MTNREKREAKEGSDTVFTRATYVSLLFFFNKHLLTYENILHLMIYVKCQCRRECAPYVRGG